MNNILWDFVVLLYAQRMCSVGGNNGKSRTFGIYKNVNVQHDCLINENRIRSMMIYYKLEIFQGI